MLVVIGIIAVLVGASIGGFSAMTRTAEKAKCQELVSNVATALTVMFQQEGAWPRALAQNGASDGRLDAKSAYALVAKGRTYLSLSHSGGKLIGNEIGYYLREGEHNFTPENWKALMDFADAKIK